MKKKFFSLALLCSCAAFAMEKSSLQAYQEEFKAGAALNRNELKELFKKDIQEIADQTASYFETLIAQANSLDEITALVRKETANAKEAADLSAVAVKIGESFTSNGGSVNDNNYSTYIASLKGFKEDIKELSKRQLAASFFYRLLTQKKLEQELSDVPNRIKE